MPQQATPKAPRLYVVLAFLAELIATGAVFVTVAGTALGVGFFSREVLPHGVSHWIKGLLDYSEDVILTGNAVLLIALLYKSITSLTKAWKTGSKATEIDSYE